MEWSNEKIIEFIQNYESEPILWNPEDPNYSKKHLGYEAWGRIKANLSFTATVDDLKSKMKSLMAYYRTHLNKYKKSLESGTESVYQTNWFAFSTMHSFLAPVYDCQPTVLCVTQIGQDNEETIETKDSTPKERLKSKHVRKKLRVENCPAGIVEHKQMKTFENTTPSINDEYEMFGKLIANKIRNLKHHTTREIVMKDVYDVVFQAHMKDHKTDLST